MSNTTQPQIAAEAVVAVDQEAQLNATRCRLLNLIRGKSQPIDRLVATETTKVPESPPEKTVAIRKSEAMILVHDAIDLILHARSLRCEHCGTLTISIDARLLDRIDEFLQAGLISREELRRIATREDSIPF